MQSITIGKAHEYLRLTAVHWPPPSAPPDLPRAKRRFLQAELRARDLTATARLDLRNDYAGLEQFFDQVVAHWREWENSSMAWGTHGPLALEITHGPRPFLGPDHFVVSIQLRHGGFHHRPWKVETSLILSLEQLEATAHNLHALTD